MPNAQFEQRLAKVRQRFASTLESKIKGNYAALPAMVRTGPDSIELIGDAYRRLHEICALAPTVGFPATGKAARAAEAILLESHLGGRALSASEAASLQKALDALWGVAQTELQFMYSRGG